MVSRLFKRFLPCLALLALALSAAETEIRRIASAPIIDGKGEDAVWNSIPWREGFVMLGETTRKPTAQTRFKAAHDGDCIYFLVQADEPQMNTLHATRTQRDSDIWNDDCIEILLDPNRSQDRFYHFAVSATGAIFDEERLQGGLVTSSAWNCRDVQAAAVKSEKSWQVEIGIPLVSLGLERTDGKLAFNVARERYAGRERGAEVSSFSPANRGLLAPVDFAPAQLQGGAITKFAWKLKGPYDAKTVKRNERILYSGKIHLANHSGELVRGFLSLRIDGGKSTRKTVIMDSGVASEYPVEIEIGGSGKSALLQADLRSIQGDLLLCRQIPVSIDYSPMEVTLSNPPYRNTIFSDMTLKAIEGVVRINDESAAKGTIAVSLKGENGGEIASLTCRPGRFSLPIPSLSDGKYLLNIQSGEFSRQLTIRKLPRLSGEVRFDANHVMRVDGKPFLPYGWFGCRDFERASGYGFNVVIEYAITAFKEPELKRLLDRLHALGMKLALYCYPESKMYSRPTQRLPLTKEEAEAIRRRVRSVKEHPALLAWYLCDEPDLSPALPARMKEIHDICADEDPYHPTIILNNTGEGFRKYADSGDIVMPDIYPNFMRNGNSGVPMLTVYDTLRACADSSERIIWCTPQGFNYDDCGHPGQRIPTPAELRNMHYQTLLGGATGFIWYIYEYNYPYPEVFSTLSSLLEESRRLPIHLAPEKCRRLETGRNGVIAARYDIAGKRYLVAINTLYRDERVTLPLPDGEYSAAGEPNVKVTSAKGKAEISLKPLQVRILTNDREAAEGFSVAENERRALEQRSYLKKPGNLAFGGERQVAFTLAGFGRSSLPMRHLNDGAYYDGFPVTGKNPAITLTFPENVTASSLRLYGIDLNEEAGGKVELLLDGKYVEVSRLTRDPAHPKATGPMSTFSDIPQIRYRKERDALSGKWKSASFRTLRISGFKARKIVEVEVYP